MREESKRWIIWLTVGFGWFVLVLYTFAAIQYQIYFDMGLIFFGFIPVVGGHVAWILHRKNSAVYAQRHILQFAREQGYLLTAAEVALLIPMDIEQASKALEQLRRQGMARLKVAENGVWVYEIEPLLTYEQKLAAERV
ncbi:hypothetical protein Q5741_00975 [Paenibacillus sp. JX-17]|uniref:MarR family transcriptional regulator n=1 Tax=Paenibacillus lacisoli TaxID=3064525 RepID=A0ABT9C6T3_9BACL|nr:hypothetical protein [Paenibacillus sp. JX-17]MDO7904982.1 hypothetical protein [Paenibacillus sp. JX-17]